MRFVFLFCGFLGFAVVSIGGLTAGRAMDLVLRDAALGCLAGAMVGRWFWGVTVRSFEQAVIAKRAAEAAAEAEAAAAAASAGSAAPAKAPAAAGRPSPAAAVRAGAAPGQSTPPMPGATAARAR